MATGTDVLTPEVPRWRARSAPPSAPVVRVSCGEVDGTNPYAVSAGSGTPDEVRRAGAAAGRLTRSAPAVGHDLSALGSRVEDEDTLTAYIEGVTLGRWRPPRWTNRGLVSEVVAATHDLPGAPLGVVERAVTRSRAELRARTLATTPSNVKTPAWLARQAVTMARRAGLESRIWTPRMLAAEGFGGLLAVGNGSSAGPRLVELAWQPPGSRGARPIVLVGKGITFDTGGVNVKPAEGMLGMKTDMSGAAIVTAVLGACADLGVRVPVIGLLPLAENAIGGRSYRPSDVLTHYDGRTTEVRNTDAEGRVVLADALGYAATHLAPRALVDIATLTGAARLTFGRSVAPVFGTDDGLAHALIAAGGTTGETLWRMPLPATYRADLSSDVADIAQAVPGGAAGSVYAALFLREFVGALPWAHLDIAGTGRSDVDAGLVTKGPTGFGTRLLLRYLEGLT